MWKFLDYHSSNTSSSPASNSSASDSDVDAEKDQREGDDNNISKTSSSTAAGVSGQEIKASPTSKKSKFSVPQETQSPVETLTKLSLADTDTTEKEDNEGASWYSTEIGKAHLRICPTCGNYIKPDTKMNDSADLTEEKSQGTILDGESTLSDNYGLGEGLKPCPDCDCAIPAMECPKSSSVDQDEKHA